MANRRSKIMDAPVHPAILPGLIMIADSITGIKTESHTVVFPAKTIIAVVVSQQADTDAEKVAYSWSVTANVATVTFTPTSAGTAAAFSYIILASVTETIAAGTATSAEVITPIT
jgi:hypothetical protein